MTLTMAVTPEICSVVHTAFTQDSPSAPEQMIAENCDEDSDRQFCSSMALRPLPSPDCTPKPSVRYSRYARHWCPSHTSTVIGFCVGVVPAAYNRVLDVDSTAFLPATSLWDMPQPGETQISHLTFVEVNI